MTWDDLNFFSSQDWKAVQIRLDYMDGLGIKYNPKRELIFAALDETPFEEVKVAWLGQDPYPDSRLATGLAYAIPNHAPKVPPSLSNIFREYMDDLGYTMPRKTDLTKWTSQGVLLWNTIPTCTSGSSLSHDWPEWKNLTREIVSKLSEKSDVVFVLNGSRARGFSSLIQEKDNSIIETAHPSPLSVRAFKGCRLFSRTNQLLVEVHGLEPIDWEI